MSLPPFELFTAADFELECGVTLRELSLAYQITGRPRQDTAPIITFSAFSQNYDDLAYLRGSGAALDPARDWIIHCELVGNGRGSSPSNYPDPDFAGPRFPKVTIRDNVRLQRMLLNKLGVTKIKAALGASMGGQQAIQWCVSYPESVEKAVLIAASCRASLHSQLFLNALASAIRSDPAFDGGNYKSPPLEGLSRMSEYWAPWALSPLFYSTGEYQKYPDTSAASLEEFLAKWRTRYHQKDANNLLAHMQTWAAHDVAQNAGCADLKSALARVQAEVLFVIVSTDAYFTAPAAEEEASLIPRAAVRQLESISGHAAAFGRSEGDRAAINRIVSEFLADGLVRPETMK